MFKIKSISQMEQELLALSKASDVIVGEPSKEDEQKHITEKQAKQDVVAFARILINAYCGWPFHDKIVKRKVLKKLLSIYNNAHDMKAIDLFNELRSVMQFIPDRHIRIELEKNQARYVSGRKNRNVGKNVASENTIVTELRSDNVAVVGFYKMYHEEWAEKQLQAFMSSLKKSSALIVDLRGNGGGNSEYSDNLAKHLCGGYIRSAKKIFVRNNPDAEKFFNAYPYARWGDKRVLSGDPALLQQRVEEDVNLDKGYNKPIYILTNGRTGSSSEMFLLRMIHHPRVKVVGDNSGGMEVYGNVGHGFLPHSNIKVFIGMNYRELEFDNFETKGYKPDILCKDGQDAFDVAMADLNKQIMLSRNGIEK